MSMFRRVGLVALLIAVAAGLVGLTQGCAAEEAVPAASDPYALPAGDAKALLAFIEGLANPTEDFENQDEARKHLERASVAISDAADKILAGEATEQQAVDATQWKVESLRIREFLGDKDAGRERDEFLDRMLQDPRPAVAGMVAPLRLMPQLTGQRWFRLDAARRTEAIDRYVADVKAAGPTPIQGQLLIQFTDLVGDTPYSDDAVRAVDELLPVFTASSDPRLQRMTELLQGIAKRLRLPGTKIELSGTLMDGTELDWESYRGKVVLVDFWASWCEPCRREVPNVLANFEAYRDKEFEVLGICLDDDRAEAEQYIKEASVVWPSLFSEDPAARGWEHPMARKYGINGVPRAILVNQDGVVVSMMARGPLLGAQLQQLLGEPTPKPSGDGSATEESEAASEATP